MLIQDGQVNINQETQAPHNAGLADSIPVIDRFTRSSADTGLPLVTLIITNYNYEKYLLECLMSVSNQDYSNIECIIVDDKSGDGSVELVRRYISDKGLEARFRLIVHEQNQGQLGAFVTGYTHARGSFVVFVDADDILLENFVSIHVRTHLQNPPVAFTCSAAYGISENRELRGYVKLGNFGKKTVKVTSQPFYTLQWPWSCTSSMMFRKATLLYVPVPDLFAYRYCADLYICYVANLLGGSILLPDAYTGYRLHESNQFQTNPITGDAGGIGDMKKHPRHMELLDSIRAGFISQHDRLESLLGTRTFLNLIARTTPLSRLKATCQTMRNNLALSNGLMAYFIYRVIYKNTKYWYWRLFKPAKFPQRTDL